MLRAAALLLSALVASGCSHTVTLKSDPPGARIFIDGEDAGKAPITLEESSGFFDTHQVRVEKEGFSTVETTISQTVPIWPVIIPSLCFAPVSFGTSCFGLMYGLRYGQSYEYKLSKIGEQDSMLGPSGRPKPVDDPKATIPY